MKKIGIVFPPQKSGGVYQLALTIFESLKLLKKYRVEKIFLKKLSRVKKFFNLIFGFSLNENFDLLIFPTPFSEGFPKNIPFVVFLPDLMHLYYPSFPEYSLKVRFSRNLVYKIFTKRAKLIVVDSKLGKTDLIKFFKIAQNKIKILPYCPPPYIFKYQKIDPDLVLKKYQLPEKFLFYPANFWYHKNHLKLIGAVARIREKYQAKVFLVLTGSLASEYQKQVKAIENLIQKLNLKDQVFILGYVSEKELVALYKKSQALIFPSLIGPTNIPPLEAIVLEKPIICSNLFEMPKQIGEAGLFFNPFDVEDIAEKIYKIWKNESLKNELIQKIHKKIKELTLENYAKKWENVINQALKTNAEKRN